MDWSWPCLHQWLETRPRRQMCPVCKSGISRDKVIPLYGRNGDQKDPRDTVPPRPQGQRSEAPNVRSAPPLTCGWVGHGAALEAFPSFNWGGNGGEGGFQFSFGIGAFPFGLFATHLNFGDRRPGPRSAFPCPTPSPQTTLVPLSASEHASVRGGAGDESGLHRHCHHLHVLARLRCLIYLLWNKSLCFA